MSERVTVEELRRVLDTLEQAAEDHASADRTVASDDIGVAVDALERAADTIAALERERDAAITVITRIANYSMPDDMEEDDDGFTEWGCDRQDAIEMALENAIYEAQSVLKLLRGGE